jgi:Domain of unknown function (DUF4328)
VRWVVAVLALIALVDLAAIASGIAEHRLLSGIEAGEFVTEADVEANDIRQVAVGITQFGLLVACAVFFLRWFHRAYRNLLPLGATELRFTQGWAVGAWFVPILNLWRPKQIANDIWRASDPGYEPGFLVWRAGSVPALYAFWWGLFLGGNWVSQIAARLTFSAEEASELQNATTAYLVSDAADFLAALVAILVVRRTTARQEDRARRLAAAAEAT